MSNRSDLGGLAPVWQPYGGWSEDGWSVIHKSSILGFWVTDQPLAWVELLQLLEVLNK